MDEYQLVPLFDRQDQARKCIELLNEEWPRSDGSREHSQKKSCRPEPPMSFLLFHQPSDTLVGHSRVCNLPNRKDGCWIESVIVSRSERGKGLGKLLMKLTEEALKKFGFTEAFLSTEDKVEFYKHCGYEECAPILHSTAATSVFPIMMKLETNLSNNGALEKNDVVLPPSSGPPPPPPPPPPAASSTRASITTIDHQYMKKCI